MQSSPEGHGREARVILPALLLVLLIGAGYYWYASRTSTPAPAENATTTTPAIEVTGEPAANVEVSRADISAGSVSKLPEGFPASIPVELPNIKESFKALYGDQKATQYTVSYTSSKTADQLWTIYTTYLASAGYKIDKTSSSTKAPGNLRATKDQDEISIIITKANSSSFVQINLVDR